MYCQQVYFIIFADTPLEVWVLERLKGADCIAKHKEECGYLKNSYF